MFGAVPQSQGMDMVGHSLLYYLDSAVNTFVSSPLRILAIQLNDLKLLKLYERLNAINA